MVGFDPELEEKQFFEDLKKCEFEENEGKMCKTNPISPKCLILTDSSNSAYIGKGLVGFDPELEEKQFFEDLEFRELEVSGGKLCEILSDSQISAGLNKLPDSCMPVSDSKLKDMEELNQVNKKKNHKKLHKAYLKLQKEKKLMHSAAKIEDGVSLGTHFEWNSSTVNISLPTLCSQEKIPLPSTAIEDVLPLQCLSIATSTDCVSSGTHFEWNSSTVNISLPTLCSQEKIPLQSSAAAKLKTLKNAKRKLKKKQMKLKEILEEDVETLEFPDFDDEEVMSKLTAEERAKFNRQYHRIMAARKLENSNYCDYDYGCGNVRIYDDESDDLGNNIYNPYLASKFGRNYREEMYFVDDDY